MKVSLKDFNTETMNVSVKSLSGPNFFKCLERILGKDSKADIQDERFHVTVSKGLYRCVKNKNKQ